MSPLYEIELTPLDATVADVHAELRRHAHRWPYIALERSDTDVRILIQSADVAGLLDVLPAVRWVINPARSSTSGSEDTQRSE